MCRFVLGAYDPDCHVGGAVMRAQIGGGWAIHHLTDRVIELRKDDYAYRRFTERDGYVRVRAEPGMDRQQMVNKAIEMAKRNDAELALRIGKRLAPSLQSLADYTNKQVQMNRVFSTPEEPGRIGVKRP
jgi:hypothetical protein